MASSSGSVCAVHMGSATRSSMARLECFSAAAASTAGVAPPVRLPGMAGVPPPAMPVVAVGIEMLAVNDVPVASPVAGTPGMALVSSDWVSGVGCATGVGPPCGEPPASLLGVTLADAVSVLSSPGVNSDARGKDGFWWK